MSEKAQTLVAATHEAANCSDCVREYDAHGVTFRLCSLHAEVMRRLGTAGQLPPPLQEVRA